jgi:hypothetical protein
MGDEVNNSIKMHYVKTQTVIHKYGAENEGGENKTWRKLHRKLHDLYSTNLCVIETGRHVIHMWRRKTYYGF